MLNNENYFSKENGMKYVSVSQIKRFQQCEARALAELKGEWEEQKSTALLVGSYVDIALTGTDEEMDSFKEAHPEMYSSRGSTKGQLKTEFKKAQEMVDIVKADALMMKTLSGEHQVIMTGELFGVPCKIKIDSLHEHQIVDLKTTADISKAVFDESKGKYVSWIEYWQYPLQMAVYREIARQNGYSDMRCFLTVIDKTEVPDKAIFEIDAETMDEKLAEIEMYVKQVQEIKQGNIEPTRCEKCNYCKSTKKVQGILDWREVLGEID